MNEKVTQRINSRKTVIEDLNVNEDPAEEVKGCAQVDYFLRLRGIEGDITS